MAAITAAAPEGTGRRAPEAEEDVWRTTSQGRGGTGCTCNNMVKPFPYCVMVQHAIMTGAGIRTSANGGIEDRLGIFSEDK